MKKFLAPFFFIILCRPLPLAALDGHFVARPGGQSLAEYIDSLPIESTTSLAVQTGFANNEVPPNIARLVNLKELHIGTSLSVGGTQYLEHLRSGIEFSKIPDYSRTIILPQELFSLPFLEKLHLNGLAQYRLKAPLRADELKSNIRELSIMFPYNETIDFWPVFQNVEELSIQFSTILGLDEAIYSFKNIKKLSVYNNALTVAFDERLNNLNKLETIELGDSSAIWPEDMSGLTSLKKIYSEYCAYKPEVINGQEYYFPAGIHSLPNLEVLGIAPYGRLELPPRKASLRNLKQLNIVSPIGYGEISRIHLPCQTVRPLPLGSIECDSNVVNLNNITDYSSLEEITIGVGVEDIEELKPLRWLENKLKVNFGIDSGVWLARKIKAAYLAQKMPNLKIVYIPSVEEPDPVPIFMVADYYYYGGSPEPPIDELGLENSWLIEIVMNFFF